MRLQLIHFVAGGILLRVASAEAQSPPAESARNFGRSEFYEPPNARQIKRRISGAEAVAVSEDWRLIKQVKIETFTTNGQSDYIIEAPDCLYSTSEHLARSPNSIRLTNAEGLFVEGQGFLWRQTNSSLTISNHVHSMIRGDLMGSGPAAPPGNAGNKSATTDILSDRMDFDGKSQLIYRDNVHVTGTDLALTGGLLTVDLPAGGAPIQDVSMNQNVKLDYQGTHAKAGQMDVRGHLIHFRGGRPLLHVGDRSCEADSLDMNRSDNSLHADGRATLTMTSTNAGQTGFLSRPAASAAASAPPTNREVRISCANYDLQTNAGVFTGDVRAVEVSGEKQLGRMTCGVMKLEFGETNEVSKMTATDHVVIEEQERRSTGDKAYYTKATGIVEMTGQPQWQDGPKEGAGNIARFNVTNNSMSSLGNAWIKFPANDLATARPLVPNRSGPSTPEPAEELFARVDCDHYDYGSPAGTGLFYGHVRLDHPRMKLACENMKTESSETGQLSRTVTADEEVVVDMTDQQQKKLHGTGDRMVYNWAVVGGRTNETVKLTGERPVAVIDSPQSTTTLTGPQLTYDLITGKVPDATEIIVIQKHESAARPVQAKAPKQKKQRGATPR